MNLLLTGAYDYHNDQLEELKSFGYKITFIHKEDSPLPIDKSDIDVVVCNDLFRHHDIKDFKNLKFIQTITAGLNQIPVEYVEEAKIKLQNAKGVYSIPIAEWCLLKILEIYKKSPVFYQAQQNHQWEVQPDILELTDKTAAIIGFGGIGQETAKRLKAFGVKTIGVGRRPMESPILDEYDLIDNLDEVLEKSDIVILTLPLTKETEGLMNAKRIAKMKDNSVLINVARGPIIEEQALIEALQAKKFLGIALDVFKQEPLPKENPLWDFKEVLITPHISYASNKIDERLFNVIRHNLKEYIQSTPK